MITHLKKYASILTWAGLLLGLFLVTRLVNLTILPIFTDEAIYIRWSQIGGSDASWRFISLTDGKQPLFTWLVMISLRIFQDPLVAGRLVSVGAGFLTLIGLLVVSYEFFKSKRISIITGLLYIISPFSLMYDRLALYDSLSTAFAVWSFYLAVRLVRTVRLDIALILGLVLGFGMINKTSGFLSLYLLPASLILFDWKEKKRIHRLLRWGLYVGIAAFLSQLIYAVLRLSPYFHMISQKDSVFVYPVSQIFYTWRFFLGNLNGVLDWFINYLTIPLVVLMIPAFFIQSKHRKEIFLLTVWCLAPFFALAYFGKVLYPRYILFMVIPLLTLSAITFNWILNRRKMEVRVLILIVFILFPAIRSSYYILFNPAYAPIPYSDKGQLIDDWPSGWGVAQVNTFFQEELKKGEIAVFTEGTFGLLPYAIEIYHVDNPRIFIKGLWPIPEEFTDEILEQARTKPTYIVLNYTSRPPSSWPVEKIAEYQKGSNPSRTLRLYKVITPPFTVGLNTPTLRRRII